MVGTKVGQEKQAAARCGMSHAQWKAHRDSGLARCYCCEAWKPVELFCKDVTRATGRASICKLCMNRKSTASRYGLTLEQMDALDGADGVCPLCKRAGETMHVDHCHATSKVRGFLCTRCNVGLGQFEDNPALLRDAIAYLENHNAP